MPEITTDEGILRKISQPVNDLDVGEVVEQLSISIPNKALGLSAPQIGIHKRAFLANLSSGSYVFINPVFPWKSPDKVPSTEACLSIPGVTRCIQRYSSVDVSCSKLINAKDGSLEVEPEPLRLGGQDAFIVQHELDHLDGVLITDYEETKSSEQLCLEREQDRKQRIAKKRLAKASKKITPPKPAKLSAKRLAKKKRDALKEKRRRRTLNKQEKIRVEIQERFLAEQEGLLEDQNTSTNTTENQESAER